MGINDWLDQAKNELRNLQDGEIFGLKDLFKGYEWKRINQGDKCTLGTLFRNFVSTNSQIELIKNGGILLYKINRSIDN